MRIFVPKEMTPGEKRAPVVPETAKKLVALGAEVVVEKGLGAFIHRSDPQYEEAGARVIADRIAGLTEADAVLRLQKPPTDEIAQLRANSVHISFLDPFNERDLVERLGATGQRDVFEQHRRSGGTSLERRTSGYRDRSGR